ncbi:hypothetical protein C8J57DRAFT_1511887 [Mycena rebaudengoi]|nr:hypothetical protein C8J57DRAFT_1511887 [Mycena rebaudengoi]
MGTPAFDAIYPDWTGFAINWKAFYETLMKRLLSDAYERYVGWVGEKIAVPAPQASHSPDLLKRAREQYGDESDPKRAKLDSKNN